MGVGFIFSEMGYSGSGTVLTGIGCALGLIGIALIGNIFCNE
jgi:hypothetical protein